MPKQNMTAFGTLALVLFVPGAATPGPIIVSEYDTSTAMARPIRSAEDFAGRLTVEILPDARSANPTELRDLLARLDLRTPSGLPIADVVIDPNAGGFVGVDDGTIELAGSHPDGSLVIAHRNTEGRYAPIPAERLIWARPDGSPVCHTLQSVRDMAPQIAVTLLLDRSGSMQNVADDVLETTRHFLSLLPDQATCTVASFAEDMTAYTPQDGEPCGAVTLPDTLPTGGATDIYQPLSDAYLSYANPDLDGWQKMVVVITDGVITAGAWQADVLHSQVRADNGETRTLVYWLGQHDAKHLQGLADYFIQDRGEVRASLTRVLDTLGDAYGTQQVLTPAPPDTCQP